MKHQGCAVIVVGVASVMAVGVMADQASAQALGGDTEWATIGAAGNKGFDLTEPIDKPRAIGRGVVNYEYRMATLEVTTGQWIEFMNAVNATDERGQRFVNPQTTWGGLLDNSYSGPGARYILNPEAGPDAARIPISGLGFREAARFCNWLHHGKQTNAATLGFGAYDTSTFGSLDGGPTVTDQEHRSPGAKFWIPGLDEWLKAVHYDPAKANEDGSVGGWWSGPNGSNDPLAIGLPEDGGETSGGLNWRGEYYLPVGLYESETPWGLRDASGSVGELLEDFREDEFQPRVYREFDGSFLTQTADMAWLTDQGAQWGTYSANGPGGLLGLRIASAVPAPGTVAVGAVCSTLMFSRRRSG